MLGKIGTFFAERFRRWLPDSFIFALILTLIAAVGPCSPWTSDR